MSYENRFQQSVVGKVVATERRRSSRNGNPRFLVTLDNGVSYSTPVDAAMSYGIENSEYKEQAHRFGLTRTGTLNGYSELAE